MTTYECTALFIDIRNFTSQLNEKFDSIDFIDLINKTYLVGIDITSKIAGPDNFYINSTGDGYLIVVFGDNHYIAGFLVSLILQKKISQLFEKNSDSAVEEGDYFFGIGIESGVVKKAFAQIGATKIETYLGNVINIAARLEALTKEHARAPIIYGPTINELLVLKLIGKSYNSMMDAAKQADTAEKAENLHKEMSKINSILLSSYLFEHRIKGVKQHIATFRVSPTLFLSSDESFQKFITLLPNEYQQRIAKIIIE
jgi:hypothetical protein